MLIRSKLVEANVVEDLRLQMQDIAEQGEAPRGFYAEIAFDSVGPRLGDIDQPREGGEDRIDIIARNLLVAIIIIEGADANRSEEHTSELQSLMRNSYAVFCLKNK